MLWKTEDLANQEEHVERSSKRKEGKLNNGKLDRDATYQAKSEYINKPQVQSVARPDGKQR